MENTAITSYQVTDIFKAKPRDEIKQVVESPPVEINDFDIDAMKSDYIDSSKEPAVNSPQQNRIPESKPAPKTIDVLRPKQPDDPIPAQPVNLPEPIKREVELNEKSKEFQAKLVRIIKPSRIIGFMDMIFSRVGPMIMRRSEKADWKLDADEKDFLAEALDAMVEEEGIMFWPAKVWLILAIIFFYGMKTYDVYADYYSRQGRQLQQPQERLQQAKERHEAKLAELEIMRMELEEAKTETELHAELIEAQQAKKVGLSIKDYRKQIRKEQIQEERKTAEPAEPISEIELEYPPEDYPSDQYVYIDGELQFNKDGTPSKKRGVKPGSKAKNPYRHPTTGHLMSKSSYFKLYEEQPDLWEGKTPIHLQNGSDRPENDITDVDYEEVKADVA